MDIKLEDEKTDLPLPIITNPEENDENNEIKSENENEIGNYQDEEDAPLKKRRKRKISKINSKNDNLEGFSCDMCDYIATNATSLGKYLGDILSSFLLMIRVFKSKLLIF